MTNPVYVPCPWCDEGRAVTGLYAGMTCRNCHGRKRVIRGSVDEACHHEFEFERMAGRQLELHRCVTCHLETTIDSS